MKNQDKQTVQSPLEDAGSYFAYGDEEAMVLTLDSYIRLGKFGTGDATHADRQTYRIRLMAGIYLLDNFEYDAYADALLARALIIVTDYRTQQKRELRKLDVGAMDSLRKAMILVDELIEKSAPWDQVLAYKFGQDHCLVDSEKVEYVRVTIH